MPKTLIRNSQQGLTLIEILVVLVILGLLFSWLGTSLFDQGSRAKRSITDLMIKKVGSQIGQFQLQYNALPSSLDDLVKCTEKTGANCVPLCSENDLKDAWGNRLQYSLEEGGRRYKLKSLGADGREGGEGVNSDPFGTGP